MTELDALIASLAESAQPVRPAPHPLRLCLRWSAGAFIYIALASLMLGWRADLAARLHSPLFLAELGLLAAVMVSTLLAAALLSFPDLHQKARLAWLPLPALALFAAFLFTSFTDSPALPPPPHGMECLTCITLLATAPAAWVMHVLRRQASTHYRLAGSLALLASASIGGLTLRLSENTDSVAHLIQWHYLPLAGFGVAGLALGRKFLKW